MKSAERRAGIVLGLVFILALMTMPAFAGSAVVGSVAGSMNATVGGQTLLANATIFSGDSLQVKDGAAVVAVGRGGRLVFGRETVASFLRESGEVTVLLGRGNVSLYKGQPGEGLRVKAGSVTIAPAAGFKTLGEIAMVNGAVVVTAKEGKLRVEGNGTTQEVAKGKTITVATKTARAPQGGAAGAGSGSAGMSAGTALQVGSVAAGGTSAVMSGVAISRAGDARDAAAAANSTAADAASAASDAASAAAAASEAAAAATDAVNHLGCTLDASAFDPDGTICQ